MAYASGDRITASDYNNFVNRINQVWNVGYGQTALPTITPNTRVTEKQWDDIVDVITKAGNHQGTTLTPMFIRDDGSTIPQPTKFDDKTDSTASKDSSKLIHALNAIDSNITLINNNRYNVHGYTSTELNPNKRFRITIDTLGQFTGTTIPNGQHTFRVSFVNGNDANTFFNSGGSIRLSFESFFVGHISDEEQNYKQFLTDCGILDISANEMTRENVGASLPNSDYLFTNGYYQIRNSTHLFSQKDATSPKHSIKVEATKNSSGSALTFRVSFQWLIDETRGFRPEFGIDYNTLVTVYNPDSTYLVDRWGLPDIDYISDSFPSDSIVIDPNHYNDFAVRVGNLWGDPAIFNVGYQQTSPTIRRNLNNVNDVTRNDWDTLIDVMNKMASHQGSSLSFDMTGIPRDNASTISTTEVTGMSSNIDTLHTNRHNHGGSRTVTELNTTDRLRISKTSGSGTTYRRHKFRINFSQSRQAFFNSGGRIKFDFDAYQLDSSPSTAETNYASFLQNIRTITQNINFTTESSSSGNGVYETRGKITLAIFDAIYRNGSGPIYEFANSTGNDWDYRLIISYLDANRDNNNNADFLEVEIYQTIIHGSDDFSLDYRTLVTAEYPKTTVLTDVWGTVTTELVSFT